MTTYSLDRMVVLLSVGLDPPSLTIKRHGMISLTMTSLLSRRETISMASCRNPSAAGRIPELSPKEFGPAVCLPPHLLCCVFFPCGLFAFSFFSHGFLHLCGGWGMGDGSGRGRCRCHFPSCVMISSDATVFSVSSVDKKGSKRPSTSTKKKKSEDGQILTQT